MKLPEAETGASFLALKSGVVGRSLEVEVSLLCLLKSTAVLPCATALRTSAAYMLPYSPRMGRTSDCLSHPENFEAYKEGREGTVIYRSNAAQT